MKRSKELDNIKTALVIVMLLYHSASSLKLWPKYLDVLYFIHYAFILMTGVVVGFHYFPYEKSSVKKNGIRLIQRGARLICIFLVCNLLLYLCKIYSWTALVEHFHHTGWVEFLCNPKGNLCAFEILYHIAVFLMVAPMCFVPYGTRCMGAWVLVSSCSGGINWVSALDRDCLESCWEGCFNFLPQDTRTSSRLVANGAFSVPFCWLHCIGLGHGINLVSLCLWRCSCG